MPTLRDGHSMAFNSPIVGRYLATDRTVWRKREMPLLTVRDLLPGRGLCNLKIAGSGNFNRRPDDSEQFRTIATRGWRGARARQARNPMASRSLTAGRSIPCRKYGVRSRDQLSA